MSRIRAPTCSLPFRKKRSFVILLYVLRGSVGGAMVTDVMCQSSDLTAALERNDGNPKRMTLVGVVIHPLARRPEDENRQQTGHYEEHPRHRSGVSKITIAESAEIEVEH